jgi:hypothetical protein
MGMRKESRKGLTCSIVSKKERNQDQDGGDKSRDRLKFRLTKQKKQRRAKEMAQLCTDL